MNKKFGYVTLATTKEFLKGALFLHYSLKAVKSKYPLIVLIIKELENEECLVEFDQYKIVKQYKFSQLNCPIRYIDTINKFHIFDLIEYDKMIFLDSDIYIYSNIDFLLEEYNNYNFLCENYKPLRINEDFLPRGDLFLFTPQKDFLKQIIVNINKSKLANYDDEFVFKYIIFPNNFIKNNYDQKVNLFSNLNLEIKQYYYHDSGEYKYFNYTKFTPIFLSNEDIKDKRKFFINWRRKKRLLQLGQNINFDI